MQKIAWCEKLNYEKGVSKYLQVKNSISDFIKAENLREGYCFPSVDKLAAMFGVNRLTANRAMEELAREGIIERIPGAGSFLKKRHLRESIGIIIPSLLVMEKEHNRQMWFVFQDVMQGVIKGLVDNRVDWEIVELSSLQDTTRRVDTIIDRNLKGLLFLSSFVQEPEKELMSAIRKRKIPFVTAYNPFRMYDYPSVFIDKPAGVTQALQHLIEHGHAKIGFFPPHPRPEILKEIGLVVKESRFWDAMAMPRLAEKVAATGITAIYCGSDLLAIEAIERLGAAGMKVGRDIAVIGYGNINEASFCSPPLTTLDPHRTAAGYRSVTMLLQEMNNNGPAEPVRLVPDFIIRESCGCTGEVIKA